MSARGPTIPELDQRLQVGRIAVADTAEALRGRVRRSLNALRPDQQAKRHPGATIAAAAFAGLFVGHIAGRLVATLRK